MSVAVISSLYRVEAHLEQYTKAVQIFAQEAHQAGVEVHFLPVVNDATPAEKTAIDALADAINHAGHGKSTPLYVGRETLYSSWNRGVSASDTKYLTFWNADDVRDAGAMVEGYQALEDGANLVDFVFTGVKSARRFGIFPYTKHENSRILFNPDKYTRKNGLGPFFMISREIYHTVGEFDNNFRITGDLEWAGRALPYVKFYPAKKVGGYFYIHGDNLSNTGASREDIEVNIVFMRRGDWYQLIPCDPEPLRDAWETWGRKEGMSLPDHIADFLWGEDAKERWLQYQAERNQSEWMQKIRRLLASRGLMQSVEWDLYQRKQQALWG